ncbi:Na+/H+ antiporter subunit D [Pararhizobium sp. YC-54]|uniref:Na+/H+ antiporter subunit D n=1 Tax=Pararhizobium sp. YC-54 TaxID=2986920 RepID=UPI0021F6ECFE|nr:Na+/H+ antiporter subunit D [Pararhizobium sp. YC-54]MCV9997775.1 Na+/H+ antiporter subunit D [Pararhizobium sp. YC-54]
MAASTSPADLSAALVLQPVAALDWLVILPAVWCIAIGALLMMIRHKGWLQPLIAVAALAVLVVLDAALLWHVAGSGPVTMVMGRWLPPFGIAFTADLTGALFALMSAVVAFAGAVAAIGDINASGRRYGFYPFLMLLMAGVSGAFLTGDVFNLYVWFEVLLISSFGLLVLGSEREQIDGAVKYGFLNLVATTLFLITTGYLYGIFGTLNMADIARKAPGLQTLAPLVTLTALYILAFSMKAAAFPLNFWLPASYHTPRIVVSALFAGLLTKVGIYGLIRICAMLFPAEREQLGLVLAVVAALTMLTGTLGALAQTDTRRLLGYLVISGIGAMLAGLALGGSDAIGGVIFYALHSMLVMTALYLAAGLAARLSGGFSLAGAGGLYRHHLLFTALSLMLFFAVSGLPPFSGFWPKVMLVKAAIDAGVSWLASILLLSGFLTMIATGRVFLLAYWRPVDAELAATPEPLDATALLPLMVLTALSVVIGLFPETLMNLAQQAASALSEPSAYLNSVFPAGGAP